MENPDIQNHRDFMAMAKEAIAGMRLSPDIEYASLAHRALLLAFVNAVSSISVEEMKRSYPVLCSTIAEKYKNNPMAFDWWSLAQAVDSVHGHPVRTFEKLLNTR